MARTYTVTNLAVSRSILEGLAAKMQTEGRLGSLTAYASEILSRYVSGALVSEERTKIEADLRTKILQELQGREVSDQPAIDVKAHRPAKEHRDSKHKAA